MKAEWAEAAGWTVVEVGMEETWAVVEWAWVAVDWAWVAGELC